MSFIAAAAITAGASIVGGLIGQSGSGQQAAAYNAAAAQQQAMFQAQQSNQAPYLAAGNTALNEVLGGLGLPGGTNNSTTSGQFTHQFNASDLNSNLAPNYQFQLGQGLTSVNNQMNLNGGAFSGNTLKAINDYAQNYAGNAYQQAFQNYNTNQQNIFSRLSDVAGMGQATSTNQAQVSANYAQNIGSNIAGAGAAAGGGTVGLGNAISGAGSNAGSWYSLSNILAQQQGNTLSNAFGAGNVYGAGGGGTVPTSINWDI